MIKDIGFWETLDYVFKHNPPYNKNVFHSHRFRKTIPNKYWDDIIKHSDELGIEVSVQDIFENAGK